MMHPKVEKGTQGIDGRVVAPKSKELRAFVITLGRAGEDGKTFILRDTESTFAGFAGADYNLQACLFSSTAADGTSVNINDAIMPISLEHTAGCPIQRDQH